MRYKMKAGGKKKPSNKMQMGGNFIEPDKELKFGGSKMYQTGGGMGSAGKQANYGSRNKAAEAKNKADNDLLTVSEKLTLSYEEKQKKIAERKGTGKVSVTPIQRSTARSEAARQLRDKKAKNKEAAEFYTRGQVGTPKKSTSNTATNKPKPKAAPTALQSKSAPKASSDNRPGLATATPKKMEKRSAPDSNDSRPGLAKSTTKNVAQSAPTSKKASRIDSRAEKVTDRKSKDRMATKAARINKRADRVEARKEKKSEVTAAKARLKAARRLQTGGLKTPSEDQKGLKKLPTAVRNKMGYKKSGGKY
jgi:hypothetical protein